MVHGLILKSFAILLAMAVSGGASEMEAQPYREEAWERHLPPDMWQEGALLAAGRVVRVEADAGRITIEHRPIWRFYMESMTMIFKVRDPALLIGLTPGDRIRFAVEHTEGGFVVFWIENAIQ